MGRVTIDVLPDDVLLIVFASYVDVTRCCWQWTIRWPTLAHVCRKWRDNVFRWSCHLNLQLIVHPRTTDIRKTLDVWPPFLPIFINDSLDSRSEDNLMAILEHNDRICGIKLSCQSSSPWKKVVTAMEMPFPKLTDVDLLFQYESDIPDSFLAGNAPRLRKLALTGASFLGLPKLSLFAPDLVELTLHDVPHSGYISPEAMLSYLSALTRLKKIDLALLGFKYSHPQRPNGECRRPLPSTRTALPALTNFLFARVGEYLEDLVAWIDAPLLGFLKIKFLGQFVSDSPQLPQFISRSPQLRAHDEAHVAFSFTGISVTFLGKFDQYLVMRNQCKSLESKLAFVAQVCGSSFPQALVTVKVDYIYGLDEGPCALPLETKNSEWLELSRQFTAVKDLYLSREFVPRIAALLQDIIVGERVTEVFPALERLFVSGLDLSRPDQKAFERFIAA